TREVAQGDLLVLNQGDKIPADARIVHSSNLEINEASLTGESESVKKNAEGKPLSGEKSIQDRSNMLFYGTYVTMGNGTAIAVKTGPQTEIGKISQGLEEAGTSDIPIREKMNTFGKWLGVAVIIFWMFTLIFVWIASGFTRFEMVKSLNSALDILPINIPLLTTIVLLTGVLAMAHQGVIIRNLASVDSLGRVSVVCSDKTGTLTKNQMSVQHIWANGSLFKVTGSGYTPEGNIILMDDPKNPEYVKHLDDYPYLKTLLISGFLNNNSALVKSEIETAGKDSKIIDNWKVIGSPTEGALVVLFQKVMGDYLLEDFELIEEFPFDSSIKRMTKIYKEKDEEKYFSFTKGASEILIPRCSKIVYKNVEIELREDIRKEVEARIREFASQGYRILSLCYKDFYMLPSRDDNYREKFEQDLVYLGFVTILDPPRDGVEESVKQCHDAGVKVIMITGDSMITAKAIGKQIGIIRDENDKAAEGKDLADIKTSYDFNRTKVYARVSPKHKEDIIKRYKDEDRVVAMTGDGVNDTLALNMADCGLAMGIQGTDVAKEASDMVISDDSFNSIVKGIHQGRGIFSKIRAVVFFYICINLFEGIVQFILAVILNLPYFLNDDFYLQWIFLSITLHTFPGFILTFDSISDDVMKENPRDSEEILSKNTVILLLIFGVLLSVCMLITYFITITGIYPVFPENYEFGALNDVYISSSNFLLTPQMRTNTKALTMLMLTLFFCETFLVFQIRRPNKSLIRSFIEDRTKLMFLIPGFLFFIFIALIYIPGVQTTLASVGFNFMFMFLTGIDWLVCILISLICIVSFEIVKYFARKNNITF
ncbi:MAG: HAD-IC family P-type ATPase, partial [Candidatus Lokiarchaeota archaeon]|nr:HAD-IC family P-type ATPase [Candidatus Lokiarchaeota archaeon]MBD3200032.1 HAD-IC family P-type ATPase [Candidatus Lokiarchaeota archaeon]